MIGPLLATNGMVRQKNTAWVYSMRRGTEPRQSLPAQIGTIFRRFARWPVIVRKPRMIDDAELLRQYAAERSERAFTEFVRRHVDFVYATALRSLSGDAHRAADVSQYVFAEAARKAGALAKHCALKGWLYTTARYASANIVRAELRRQHHEREAQTM